MRDVVSEIDLSSFTVLALSPRSMREAHAIPYLQGMFQL